MIVLVVVAIVNGQRGGGGPSPPNAGSAPPPATAPSATPQERWIEAVSTSTSDPGALLASAPASFGAPDGAAPDVVIASNAVEQEITGFGAALTHSSAQLIAQLPATERAGLLAELFDPDGPVRLTMLRVPIGASDFTPVEAFTFDDLPAGETDWALERFDLAPDRVAMIPVLQAILDINPDVRLIASPWSPPAWLKTTGTLEGGRLLDEASAYETYSAYLVRFVEEYAAAGIDIDYLTVQNEPQLRHPDGYPGTDLPVWQAAKLITTLGPALLDAGLDTEILGYDHNWELSPSDAATTPEGEDPAYRYPADLLRTDAWRWIAGTAFHCYSGTAAAQSRLRAEFPDRIVLVTECSGSSAPDDSPEQAFADTLSWQATNLLIDALRHQASAVLTWNLALDEDHGPHRGGCDTCSGVVTVQRDGGIARNAEYAVLAHAARFIPPGSVRLESAGPEGLPHVAFRSPAGATVLVVWNAGDADDLVTAGDGSEVVRVELSPRSLTTVSWN